MSDSPYWQDSDRRESRRKVKLAIGVLVCVLLATVGVYRFLQHWAPFGDYSRPLPAGYRLSAASNKAYISAPSGVGGPGAGPVIEVAIVKGLVVGVVDNSQNFAFGAPRHDIPGYFILDTSTHSIESDLTEAEWRSRLLARFGGREPPRLRSPKKLPLW